MKILDKNKVLDVINQGRVAPENVITAMLDEVEADNPSLYFIIYGESSNAISEINNDMSDLYVDLSCDVIWLFFHAFGKPPKMKNEEEWMLKHLSLIDSELKSLTNEIPMDGKFRNSLQERFVSRSFDAKIQFALLNYLETEVINFASFKKDRSTATSITINLLFVLVRLMGDLYNSK